MTVSNITGLIDSPVQYFIESTWKEKTVQTPPDLGSAALEPQALMNQELPLTPYKDASIPELPAEIVEYVIQDLNGKELANVALVCQLWKNLSDRFFEFPSPWLTDISHVWKQIDCKKYGLDCTRIPRINRYAFIKRFESLSTRVENDLGISTMGRPENLTLKIVLQIAKDYNVPIAGIWNQIIARYGDIPAEKTELKFFTNSIFTDTREHTHNQHVDDITNIGKECGVEIQKPPVRDFLAFLVLSYLNSPEDARTMLYSSSTFTRLLEEVGHWPLYGGFAPSGLYAASRSFDGDDIGVGASGSSEDIGTGNIGT
jgi:hypothetical protein